VILETLCDLLSEPNLLPDLFYNYDCDTQRYDLLENLTKTLSDCASYLSAMTVEVGEGGGWWWWGGEERKEKNCDGLQE